MATVIKGGTGLRGVRGFAVAEPIRAAVTMADPLAAELALLRAERDRLLAEIDRATQEWAAATARAKRETEAAIIDAREKGHREGMAAAETRDSERLAALREGIAAESGRFGERLVALDGLAAALARLALSKIFHRPEEMAEMVSATLARHLTTLRDRSGLTVRVSAADFDDAGMVEAAARDVGAVVAVTIDADLPSGACRLSARLGRTDLDVSGQWVKLADLLDGMAKA